MESCLRSAQNLNRLNLIEYGVVELTNRNTVNLTCRAIDDQRIRLHTPNRNERRAELPAFVELHVWDEIIDQANVAQACRGDGLRVEHRD